MIDDQTFELLLRPYHGGPMKRTDFTIAGHVFEEYFAPLPRERDLPFPFNAMLLPDYDALRTVQKRHAFASAIASQLAETILKLIEAKDSQHGYSPEEWSKINPQP